LDEPPKDRSADGVVRVPITRGDTREMAAEVVRIGPGQHWSASVPDGRDCYLFVLDGAAEITARTARHLLLRHAFATLEQGVPFSIANVGGPPAAIVKVEAPLEAGGRPGFRGTIAVDDPSTAATVDVPEQKKKRIYFVDERAARSQRGHAMIVVYEKDTVTGLHHHPDAESLFVVLDGALQFTVNSAPAVVVPGKAAYFGCDDRHGLRVADGSTGASFLEFHIPADYTTVYGG
jgi:quercetin dioxygenase-like cupin family protein